MRRTLGILVIIGLVAIPAARAEARPKITKACAAALTAADDLQKQTAAVGEIQKAYTTELVTLSASTASLNAYASAASRTQNSLATIQPALNAALTRYGVAAKQCRAGK